MREYKRWFNRSIVAIGLFGAAGVTLMACGLPVLGLTMLGVVVLICVTGIIVTHVYHDEIVYGV